MKSYEDLLKNAIPRRRGLLAASAGVVVAAAMAGSAQGALTRVPWQMLVGQPFFDTVALLQAAYIPTSINWVWTGGYHTYGDGGSAPFYRSSVQSSGNGKRQSADGTWWEIIDTNPNVRQFGAFGDGVTDDTASVNEAISYAIAKGYALRFPSGIYSVGALTTISSNIFIYGDGVWKTYILQSSSTGNGFLFDPNYATGGGINNLSIHAVSTNPGQTKSSGVGLTVNRGNGNWVCENVDINGFATGIKSAANFYTFFHNFEVLNASTAGIYMAPRPAGGGYQDSAGVWLVDAKVSNFGTASTNTSSIGLLVESASGDHYVGLDITVFNKGIVVKPPSTYSTNFLFFDGTLADTSNSDGWTFDSTNGSVYSISCVGCWAAFSSAGQGVKILGPSSEGIKWTGGVIRENWTNGVEINGGKGISFVGADIAQNSRGSDNTSDGVTITGSFLQCKIVGCTSGNFSSAQTNRQRYGINIGAGFTGNIVIAGNDLSNNQTAPFVNSSVSGNVILTDNLPAQVGVSNAAGEVFRGCTIGTVAAATSVFLGPNGQQTTESDTYWVAARPGIINDLYAAFSASPGVGQTFTFTLRKNGADTAMTTSATGAVFSAETTSNAITYSKGDVLGVHLVTSTTAGVARFRYLLNASA